MKRLNILLLVLAVSCTKRDEVRSGNNEDVKELLARGANVEATDDAGRTLLHYEAKNGHTEVAALLLDQGANVEATDSAGQTPLHMAAAEGHTEVAALLLDQGADVEAINRYYSPLIYRSAASGYKAIELDQGAAGNDGNINFTSIILRASVLDNQGKTALHWAAESGSLGVVNLLLQRGACINARDKYNETPLSVAISMDNYRIAKALLTFIDQAEQKLLDEYRKEKNWQELPKLVNEAIAKKMRPWLPLFGIKSKRDGKTVLDLLRDRKKELERLGNEERRQEVDEIIAMLNKYRKKGTS